MIKVAKWDLFSNYTRSNAIYSRIILFLYLVNLVSKCIFNSMIKLRIVLNVQMAVNDNHQKGFNIFRYIKYIHNYVRWILDKNGIYMYLVHIGCIKTRNGKRSGTENGVKRKICNVIKHIIVYYIYTP